jgi:Zn-dependent peptidase ImmA (M78 family)
MIIAPRKTIAVAKARGLLNELQIEQPDEIEIEKIALYKNAEVRYAPLKGMDGCIVREGNTAVITVNSAIEFEGQKRFVIAHELGHFFLHPNTRQIETVDKNQINNWTDKQETEEYEANLFAAELLMPSDLFFPRLKGQRPSFELIESLAKNFNTTYTATAVQFVLNTKEECALISSSNRQRSWFILSPGFEFQMLNDNYIHGCSCTAEVGKTKGFSRSSKTEAGYWLEGFRGNHKAYITEEARYFPTLDRTLSLLWIHDAI